MTGTGLLLQWIDVEASLRRLGATAAAVPGDLVPAILRRIAAGSATARPRPARPRGFPRNRRPAGGRSPVRPRARA